jgi:ribosomal protein S6--L-glutamate ligase
VAPSIAVLHSSPRVTWTSRRLLDAAARHGAEAHYVLWDMLSVHTGEPCRVRYRGRCGAFDTVIVRGIGRSLTPEKLLYRLTLLEALEEDGVLVVNPSHAIRLARDKLAMSLRLRGCNIPVPEAAATESPTHALRLVEEYGKAVIKPLMGSLGLGSFLADSVDTAYYITNILSALNQPIFVQKYVEKRQNRDIRVFVVDGRPLAAIYRVSSTWKTNIAQGAKPMPATLSREEADIAVRTAQCLDMLYTGVDIVESTDGKLYVLEANASPLWRGLYRATGIDPAPAIIDSVLARLKR